jgi:hypothetical protein
VAGVGPLQIVRAAELAEAQPDAQWLVREVWGRSSVGIVGGQPKCCKSWFALDLAVSVASNTPCLGHFAVEDPGRAMVYLAEDGLPQQRSRLDALCEHRRISIGSLDLHVVTEPVLRLDLEADRDRLNAALVRLRPKVLVLDPLVRLHRLDENSAQEISGLLSFLREIQRAHNVSVVLVHHASKKHRSRPGQALRGSSDIHAFGDDLVHLSAPSEAELVLSVEHRSAPALAPLRLRLVSRPDGRQTHLELVDRPAVQQVPEGPVEDRVVALIRAASEPMTRQDLRERLRINNQRLGDVLVVLERASRILRTPTGWTLPTPTTASTGELRLF